MPLVNIKNPSKYLDYLVTTHKSLQQQRSELDAEINDFEKSIAEVTALVKKETVKSTGKPDPVISDQIISIKPLHMGDSWTDQVTYILKQAGHALTTRQIFEGLQSQGFKWNEKDRKILNRISAVVWTKVKAGKWKRISIGKNEFAYGIE